MVKLFIVTDMEGVCGVVSHDDWVVPGGRYYQDGKRLLTLEVNAAVEGFFAGGATEIVVCDGHGYGGLLPELLDERVEYLRGPTPGPYPFLLDASFDCIAWVGQHAKAGTPFAHMPHTQNFGIADYRINGISVGEFGIIAMVGAWFGVRSIFGSGDEAFTQEAKQLIPGIETVAVKRGVMPGKGDDLDAETYKKSRDGAVHIHPARARARIREGAERAMRRFRNQPEAFPLLKLTPPFTKEIVYRNESGVAAGERKTVRHRHDTDLIALLNM